MHRTRHSPFQLALVALFLAALASLAQNSALLRPGDLLPGAGTVTAVGEFAMNSQGSWAALVTTDTTASGQAVVVLDGQPLVVPSGSGLAPAFSTQMRYLDLDDAGNLAWQARDPLTGQWTLLVNHSPVHRQGDQIDLNGDGAVDSINLLRMLILSGDDTGTVFCRVSGGTFTTSTFQSGILRITRNPTGAVEVQALVGTGELLPSGGLAPLGSLGWPNLRSEMDSDAAGDLVFSLIGHGIFRYRAATGLIETVVLEAAPSPVVNKFWSLLYPTKLALSDAGGAYFPATLSAPGGGAQPLRVIARNQQLLLTEQDAFEILGGGTFGSFNQSRPFRISKDEQLLWQGAFTDALGQPNQAGLFLGNKLVVKPGETRIAGLTLTSLGSGMYDLDAQATQVLLRAETQDGLTGLYRIQVKSEVVSLPGCVPKAAQLSPLSGIDGPGLLVGGLTGMRLEGPQDPSSVAFALLAFAGSDGCGSLLPGIGELLVEFDPAKALFLTAIIAAPGQFSLFATPVVPGAFAFQGLELYAQGLWYSPLSAFEPVRLSNALRYTIGV